MVFNHSNHCVTQSSLLRVEALIRFDIEMLGQSFDDDVGIWDLLTVQFDVGDLTFTSKSESVNVLVWNPL